MKPLNAQWVIETYYELQEKAQNMIENGWKQVEEHMTSRLPVELPNDIDVTQITNSTLLEARW